MTDYRWTGAPLVIRDVVIVGASMTDAPDARSSLAATSAQFDVRTGSFAGSST